MYCPTISNIWIFPGQIKAKRPWVYEMRYVQFHHFGSFWHYQNQLYLALLHEAISDESFRMPVYDILHYHSLHSHILALLQLTLPYKVWLELLGLVHQTLKMMIFNIMQQISYYPGPRAIWQILALKPG